jgi:phosphate transport system substrate-binding protein
MLRHLTAALAATAVLASVPAVAGTTLNGAGGTAIYPVLSIWAAKYHKKTGTAVNYQAIGSGGGIKQITNKTVDFGNSDKPLKPAELDKRGLTQFPQVVISIVPVVNLPGIKAGELKIDGPTLADIYLGKITRWNDKRLQALNPHVHLPNLAISVVHRSDGSGTTFNFTNYLAKVSPEWKKDVGSDTSVQWPVGLGGKGNAGVAANVQQTNASIGYVEFAYAMQNHMTYMNMKNRSGHTVKPTMKAFQAAASHADFSHTKDFYLILTNQPGAASWPITAATYMLMRPGYKAERNHNVLKFLDWSLNHGQKDAEKLDYVPLPKSVVKQIEKSWTKTLPGAWK